MANDNTDQPVDEAVDEPVDEPVDQPVDQPVGGQRSSRGVRVALWAVWIVLGAVVVGVLAAPLLVGAVVTRGEEQRALAHAVAFGMTAPEGAVPSRQCRGDGLVSCWEVDRPVSRVADEVQWAIGKALGPSVNGWGTLHGADIRCHRVGAPEGGQEPGVFPGSVTMPETDAGRGVWSCLTAARFGDSGVFVFVDPTYAVGRHGERVAVGSLVSVTAR